MLLKRIFAISLLTLMTAFVVMTPVFATTNEELDRINEQLEQIRREKEAVERKLAEEQGNLNSVTAELSKLSGELTILQKEIEQTELEITQLQLQIDQLNIDIDRANKEITLNMDEIDVLQAEADEVITEMYIQQKTNSEIDKVFNSDATSLLKLQLYNDVVQEDITELLDILKIKSAELSAKMIKLEEDKIAIVRDKVQIEEKQVSLESQQASLNQQRSIYVQKRNEAFQRAENQKELLNNLTDEEQVTLAEQTRLEQQILESITEIPNGQYVTTDTIIGQQGCSGLCTGPHLHFAVQLNGVTQNPCSHMANGPCGGGGPLQSPQKGSYYLSSGYGWRWGSFHAAIDLANSVSNAPIYAAHSGYLIKSFWACTPRGSIPCNGGGANVVTICENRNCSIGYKTQYLHLR